MFRQRWLAASTGLVVVALGVGSVVAMSIGPELADIADGSGPFAHGGPYFALDRHRVTLDHPTEIGPRLCRVRAELRVDPFAFIDTKAVELT